MELHSILVTDKGFGGASMCRVTVGFSRTEIESASPKDRRAYQTDFLQLLSTIQFTCCPSTVQAAARGG